MSTSTPPDPLAAFRAEIARLTVADLRCRFPGEFNTHRRILADARAGRCIIHDGIRAFRDFLGHVGPQGERSRTLDRIDNADPEYGPGKVRWATPREQANNRSTTRKVRGPDGTVRPVSEWAIVYRQKPDTIRNRLDLGWPEEEAVTGVRRSRATSTGGQDIPSLDDDFDRADRPRSLWPAGLEKPKYEMAYQAMPARMTRNFFGAWALDWHVECAEKEVRASVPEYDPIEHDPDPPPALARLPAYQGLKQARRLRLTILCLLTPDELRRFGAFKKRGVDNLTRPALEILGWVRPEKRGGRKAAAAA